MYTTRWVYFVDMNSCAYVWAGPRPIGADVWKFLSRPIEPSILSRPIETSYLGPLNRWVKKQQSFYLEPLIQKSNGADGSKEQRADGSKSTFDSLFGRKF
jgi:hypothetical protein